MSAPGTKPPDNTPSPLTEEGWGEREKPKCPPSPTRGEGVSRTSPAPPRDEGGFLSRWSRRKHAAEAGQPLPEPVPPPTETRDPADLPDPATLSFDDDFSAYLGTQVPATLKRAAMAKLFADPSFNKMDGLDVYIEDYNLVPDLTATERDLLTHAKEVLSEAPTADKQASQPTEAELPASIATPDRSPSPPRTEPRVSALTQDLNEKPGAQETKS